MGLWFPRKETGFRIYIGLLRLETFGLSGLKSVFALGFRILGLGVWGFGFRAYNLGSKFTVEVRSIPPRNIPNYGILRAYKIPIVVLCATHHWVGD